MKSPDDVQKLLTHRFQHKHPTWLLDENDVKQWPLEISLNAPTEKEAYAHMERFRAWITAWQHWQGAGHIVHVTKRWRLLGNQTLPHTLVLQEPKEVMLWVGELTRWQRACSRFQLLLVRWPTLKPYLPKYFNVLADYDDENFDRLVATLDWIIKNPCSNLYPRQLPIVGIDSKWFEKRMALLSDLTTAFCQKTHEDSCKKSIDLFQCCGLKTLPQFIHMRVLDQSLRNQLGGLTDITAPIEQLAALTIKPHRILIVENLQTGLAFCDMDNTIVFTKLGYAVSILAQLPWIFQAKCFYWGDLDTHGFAILNQIRSYIFNIQSILMDQETLLDHQSLWSQEKQPHAAQSLPLLNDKEQAVYHAIKQQKWGQNVRLEQERIAWDYAMQAFKQYCS